MNKVLWISSITLNQAGANVSLDNGKPWAVFTLEDIVYNAGLQDYIFAKGP